jgi:hypothetical protein
MTYLTKVGRFDVQKSINPRHRWRASDVVLDGSSNVSQFNDSGRVGGMPFTQASASLRCPLATDGNGNVYAQPNGTSHTYQAGVAANWKFLTDGSKWTWAAIYHMPSAPSASQYLAICGTGGGAVTQAWFVINRVSSTVWGPWLLINSSGGGNVISIEDQRPNTSISCVVGVHRGYILAQNTFVKPYGHQLALRNNGDTTSQYLFRQADSLLNNYSSGDPGFPLTLFSTATPGSYFGGRLYEMWIDDKCVSDELLGEHDLYARSVLKAAA